MIEGATASRMSTRGTKSTRSELGASRQRTFTIVGELSEEQFVKNLHKGADELSETASRRSTKAGRTE